MKSSFMKKNYAAEKWKAKQPRVSGEIDVECPFLPDKTRSAPCRGKGFPELCAIVFLKDDY